MVRPERLEAVGGRQVALAPAIYLVSRLAYRQQGKLKLVTATIVAVALVALVVTFTHS